MASLVSDLSGRVAIITGASRGIGRSIALKLASCGCDVVVAAKTVTPQPTLEGTIHTVASEITATGQRALAVQCDVRSDADIQRMVDETLAKFGRIDILVCNSGALWWKNVDSTPMSKYDLVNGINVRATFSCVRAVLPAMQRNKFGRIIVMSPPIDLAWLRQGGKVAYLISKFGMTMVAHGLARELQGTGVSINALWPATLIESFATKNFNLADRREWRKADIVADAVASMISEDASGFNGRAVIDDEYLQSVGVSDFRKYRCVDDHEPHRIWPISNEIKTELKASGDSSQMPPSLLARL